MALRDHGVVRAAASRRGLPARLSPQNPAGSGAQRGFRAGCQRNPEEQGAEWLLGRAEEVGGWILGRWQHPAASVPLQHRLLRFRYLKQISELTFPEEEQLKKFNHLKTYNLQEEMKSLR